MHQKDSQFVKFMEVIKNLQVTVLFTELITQIPSYTKCMKDILTKKMTFDKVETIAFTAEVSALLQNKSPPKLKDPGSFSIPCTIGNYQIDKALCDLGASVSVIPYSIYVKLNMGVLKCDDEIRNEEIDALEHELDGEELPLEESSHFIEAIATPTNDAHAVINLFKKIIFPRFGVPRAVISDRGTHFGEKQLDALLEKYGAFRLSVELEQKAYWAVMELNMDKKLSGEKRLLQLNELDEFRLQAYENSRLYKEKTKRCHVKKILNKEFQVGDKVLLFNSLYKIFPENYDHGGPVHIPSQMTTNSVSLK
ncbi:uncharacterized protein LOC141588042 [Silene latifolia]|uniref:uncharacterized protein LOC141588042 n=1 Tax=Silene latifolia TaxID=37657 RepID=UPI003D774231